jgi:hypothetical protein
VIGGRTAALIANQPTVGTAASAAGRRGGTCEIAVLSNWIISNLLRAIVPWRQGRHGFSVDAGPGGGRTTGAQKKSCGCLYGPRAVGRLACMNRTIPPAAPAFEDLPR